MSCGFNNKTVKKLLKEGLAMSVLCNIAPIIVHTSWVAYQIGAGQKYNLVPTEHQTKSIHDGILYFVKHPNTTAKQNHDNWVKFKISTGWKYGEVKDEKKKTHPDLVPWNKLPQVERNKDVQHLFAMKEAYRLSKIIACSLAKS